MSKKKKKTKRLILIRSRTVTPKIKKEKELKETLCNACCTLLMERVYTTSEIAILLNAKFPNKRGDALIINYYRSRINTGKLESIGFPTPNEKLVPIKEGVHFTAHKEVESKVKPATKKKHKLFVCRYTKNSKKKKEEMDLTSVKKLLVSSSKNLVKKYTKVNKKKKE